MNSLLRLAACLAWLVILSGCGGEALHKVTGSVLDGGQPVPIERYEAGGNCIQLEFCPLSEDGSLVMVDTYFAIVKEDGSFVIDGFDGSGIPPGKYRVAVRRVGETPNGPDDLWQGKFAKEVSPFEYDIQGNQEIMIDIATATNAESTP